MPENVWSWDDPITGQGAFMSRAGTLWGNWIGYQDRQDYWDDWADYSVWKQPAWQQFDLGGQFNNNLYAFTKQGYDPWTGSNAYSPQSSSTFARISADIDQYLQREFPQMYQFQDPLTAHNGELNPTGLDESWAAVNAWDQATLAGSRRFNVPANLIKAIMYLESGGQNLEPNGANAVGPMQVVTTIWGSDAQNLGLNLFNPTDNIAMGAYVLRQAYDQYKDWAVQNGIDPWKAAVYAYYAGNPYNLNAADDPNQGGSGISTGEYGARIWNNYLKLQGGLSTDPNSGSPGQVLGSANGIPTFWALTQGQEFPITQEIGGNAMDYSNYDWTLGVTGHPGIDIGTPLNTKLFAPVAGVVTIAGGTGYFMDDTIGNLPQTGELMITLANGDQIILGHMSNISVHVGDTITAGQYVGDSGWGGTNAAGGPHVHMEYRRKGSYSWGEYQAIDPRLALQGIFSGTFTSGGGQNAIYRAGADTWSSFMRAISRGEPVAGYASGSAKANFHNFMKNNLLGSWATPTDKTTTPQDSWTNPTWYTPTQPTVTQQVS